MEPVPAWQSFTVVALIAIFAWLAARLAWRWPAIAGPDAPNRRHLTGSPWLALACALAFALLTTALLANPLLGAFDDYVRAAVRSLYDDAFVHACVFITAFGDTTTLIAVTGVSAAWLWVGGRRQTMLGLLISALGSQLAVYVLKYAIDRGRPAFETFAHAATPSFPSAHATGAVAVYGFVVYALAARLTGRLRFECLFWGGFCIALLAASRVIIGVHYLSDVIAGLLVGLFWLLIGQAVERYLSSRTGC